MTTNRLGINYFDFSPNQRANTQLDLIEENFSSESSKLRADINNNETKVQELTEELEWKNHENAELLR